MTKIVAHRGLSARFPENTMPSFEAAVETGCDGIELDVQLSVDGQLVVIHDETLERTTNGSGRVRDFTLEELRRLDASRSHPGASGPQRIPSFAEYLDFIADKPQWTNIELKNGIYPYPGLEEKVIQAVRERGFERRVLFSSFNHQSMLSCKRLAPEIEVAFVTGSWLVSAGAYCRANGADFLNPRFCYLSDENMAELRASGMRVQAWTVNEKEDMERLFGMEAFAIITNDPVLALRTQGR